MNQPLLRTALLAVAAGLLCACDSPTSSSTTVDVDYTPSPTRPWPPCPTA